MTRGCRAMSSTLEQQAAAGSARPGSRSAAAKATAAAGDGGPDPGERLALDGSGALGALLPLHTAFQLLVAPSLSHGIGLRLKREGSHPAHRVAHDDLVLGFFVQLSNGACTGPKDLALRVLLSTASSEI